MIRAVAGQKIGGQLVSASTGADFTGAVTVSVTVDAGVQATGTVSAGACVHEGKGYHTYAPSAAETDGSLLAFTFSGSGAVTVTVQVFTISAAVAAALSASSGAPASTGLSVCRAAAIEIGHLDPLETLTDGDAAFILGALNQVFDDWNAERDAVYADVFTAYTLTPSLTPHTIGPTGTFVTAQRPVSIDGAMLVMTTSTPDAFTRIHLRDAEWWDAQSVPDLTSTLPTDCYYKPTWPNGSLYFWPVPTVAYGVQLRTRLVLASSTLAATFTMPPGYLSAVTLTVAEAIAAPLGIALSPTTVQRATQARARIAANNRAPTPKLRTRDSGMPGGGRGSRGNYLTGWQ